jgi:hypothetical protein
MPSRSISRFVLIGLSSALFAASSGMAAATASVGKDRVQAPHKAPLHLTEAQRKLVVDAVSGWDTNDKLPDGFNPVVGAKIPSQKKLPIHPVPPPANLKVPELKSYDYAKLPDKILLIDPMTRKVVEVIAR